MESILNIDIPVQMYSCTNTTGDIIPLRFKFRDRNGEIISVRIDQIIKDDQDTNHMVATFNCTAVIKGIQRNFTLRYNFNEHKWHLARINISS